MGITLGAGHAPRACSEVVRMLDQLLDVLISPTGPWSVNRLVELVLPGASYAVPLNATVVQSSTSLVELDVTLTNVAVEGLDSLLVFDVLEPIGAHRLRFEASRPAVSLRCDLCPVASVRRRHRARTTA